MKIVIPKHIVHALSEINSQYRQEVLDAILMYAWTGKIPSFGNNFSKAIYIIIKDQVKIIHSA